MDNRSLNWIDFSQALNAMMSIDVKFLLHVLQIMDFQLSLRKISFQMLYCVYNKKKF